MRRSGATGPQALSRTVRPPTKNQPVQIDVSGVESPATREIYLTARPDPQLPLQRQGHEIFAAIRRTLATQRLRIAQERIFAPAHAVEMLQMLRSAAYGDLDDGVSPAWLSGGPEPIIRGVQIHAVSQKPRPLAVNGTPCGRLIEQNGCRWITASGLPTRRARTRPAQVRRAFAEAEILLKQGGGNVDSIARTWFFLRDILDWYESFNDTRSRYFIDRGLLSPTSGVRLPASTGIGVAPAGNGDCLMDLIAVVGNTPCPRGEAQCLCKHLAAGKQQSAYEYGSSFARAATVCTPAGRTVYVSGTAAIDPSGATCHRGDIAGQIRMTLDCINAVLDDLQCSRSDVVQAIAYCKTPEVEAGFEKQRRDMPWPWLVVPADVCRDDLLFEAEVTACAGAKEG